MSREQDLDNVIQLIFDVEEELLKAMDEHAKADYIYEQAYAEAFRSSSGSNTDSRKQDAIIAVKEQSKALHNANRILEKLKQQMKDAHLVCEARRSLLSAEKKRPV